MEKTTSDKTPATDAKLSSVQVDDQHEHRNGSNGVLSNGHDDSLPQVPKRTPTPMYGTDAVPVRVIAAAPPVISVPTLCFSAEERAEIGLAVVQTVGDNTIDWTQHLTDPMWTSYWTLIYDALTEDTRTALDAQRLLLQPKDEHAAHPADKPSSEPKVIESTTDLLSASDEAEDQRQLALKLATEKEISLAVAQMFGDDTIDWRAHWDDTEWKGYWRVVYDMLSPEAKVVYDAHRLLSTQHNQPTDEPNPDIDSSQDNQPSSPATDDDGDVLLLDEEADEEDGEVDEDEPTQTAIVSPAVAAGEADASLSQDNEAKVQPTDDKEADLPPTVETNSTASQPSNNNPPENDAPSEDDACKVMDPAAAAALLSSLDIGTGEPPAREQSRTAIIAMPDMPLGDPTVPYAPDNVSKEDKDRAAARAEAIRQAQQDAEAKAKEELQQQAPEGMPTAAVPPPANNAPEASPAEGLAGAPAAHISQEVPVVRPDVRTPPDKRNEPTNTDPNFISGPSLDPEPEFTPRERTVIAQAFTAAGLDQVIYCDLLWQKKQIPEDSLGGGILASFYQEVAKKDPLLKVKFITWTHWVIRNRPSNHPKADTKPSMLQLTLDDSPLDPDVASLHNLIGQGSQKGKGNTPPVKTNIPLGPVDLLELPPTAAQDLVRTDQHPIVPNDSDKISAGLAWTLIGLTAIVALVLDRWVF